MPPSVTLLVFLSMFAPAEVAAWRIVGRDGRLAPVGDPVDIPSPACITIVP
jgi:hypothetical protein